MRHAEVMEEFDKHISSRARTSKMFVLLHKLGKNEEELRDIMKMGKNSFSTMKNRMKKYVDM